MYIASYLREQRQARPRALRWLGCWAPPLLRCAGELDHAILSMLHQTKILQLAKLEAALVVAHLIATFDSEMVHREW